MLYSSVVSPELLENVAAVTSKSLQCQIDTMLDSITCTTVPCNIHQWYNEILCSVKHGSKRPRGADIKVPDVSSNYEEFIFVGMKQKSYIICMAMDFAVRRGKGGNTCVV
jgi:hypothetical protein